MIFVNLLRNFTLQIILPKNSWWIMSYICWDWQIKSLSLIWLIDCYNLFWLFLCQQQPQNMFFQRWKLLKQYYTTGWKMIFSLITWLFTFKRRLLKNLPYNWYFYSMKQRPVKLQKWRFVFDLFTRLYIYCFNHSQVGC